MIDLCKAMNRLSISIAFWLNFSFISREDGFGIIFISERQITIINAFFLKGKAGLLSLFEFQC